METGGTEGGKRRGRKEPERTGKPTVRGEREEGKRRNRNLSSEMLKRKRTKESGSQAPVPAEKSKREAPVKRLWERNREGRKETNRKPSTKNRKRSMGNQAEEKVENRKTERKA